MHRLGLALLLVATPMVSAEAQRWREDSNSIKLDWGNVRVIVCADSTHGLEIRASTAIENASRPGRTYSAMFDPAQIDSWLSEANKVVAWVEPPASDTVRMLETSGLLASDGSEVLIRRMRNKQGWDSNVLLVLSPESGKYAWAIMADQGQIRDFLKGLKSDEGLSRLDPAVVERDASLVNGLAVDDPPARLSGPELHFPPFVSRHPGSEFVLVEFVISADGVAEPESFVALWYSDGAYLKEAVRVLAGTRYKPAAVNHHPVRTKVIQAVEFRSS